MPRCKTSSRRCRRRRAACRGRSIRRRHQSNPETSRSPHLARRRQAPDLLADYVRNVIQPQLQTSRGAISRWRVSDRAVRVCTTRLVRAHGLTAIRRQPRHRARAPGGPRGPHRGAEREMNVRAEGERSTSLVRDLVVAYRAGAPVRLQDWRGRGRSRGPPARRPLDGEPAVSFGSRSCAARTRCRSGATSRPSWRPERQLRRDRLAVNWTPRRSSSGASARSCSRS